MNRVRLSTLVVLMAAAVMLISSAPVAAHEGAGRVELVDRAQSNPMVIEYTVKLVFAADSHPAKDATVTAVADGPGQVAPVTLQSSGEDGIYRGAVRFPAEGAWTVRVTAVTPPATLVQSETITAPTTSTSVTTSPPSQPTSTLVLQEAGEQKGGDHSDLYIVVLYVVVGAVLAGLTAWFVLRSTRR